MQPNICLYAVLWMYSCNWFNYIIPILLFLLFQLFLTGLNITLFLVCPSRTFNYAMGLELWFKMTNCQCIRMLHHLAGWKKHRLYRYSHLRILSNHVHHRAAFEGRSLHSGFVAPSPHTVPTSHHFTPNFTFLSSDKREYHGSVSLVSRAHTFFIPQLWVWCPWQISSTTQLCQFDVFGRSILNHVSVKLIFLTERFCITALSFRYTRQDSSASRLPV